MQKLVSIAVCTFAAALAFPAAAADETTAKNRAGANASVEGGTALGGTGVQGAGVQSGAGGTAKQEATESQPRTGDNAGAGARTGDTQARRDNEDDSDKAAKDRAQTRKRDASSGTTGKTY